MRLWFGLISVLKALQHISGVVSYPNHTVPGQASYAVYQYLVHILSPVTDNCSSWISGRGRIAVEIFSWPSLHERMCRTWGSSSRPLAYQADMLPNELPRPAMRLWYLSHRRPAKAQVSMCIRAVSPEPLLFAHINYGSRQMVRPTIRHLAPLDGCICAFEEWVYRGRKEP